MIHSDLLSGREDGNEITWQEEFATACQPAMENYSRVAVIGEG
jgi:hypothetical protein